MAPESPADGAGPGSSKKCRLNRKETRHESKASPLCIDHRSVPFLQRCLARSTMTFEFWFVLPVAVVFVTYQFDRREK